MKNPCCNKWSINRNLMLHTLTWLLFNVFFDVIRHNFALVCRHRFDLEWNSSVHFYENLSRHWLHWSGFSPEYVFLCIIWSDFVIKPTLQYLCCNNFCTVCVHWCHFRIDSIEKCTSQWLYWNGSPDVFYVAIFTLYIIVYPKCEKIEKYGQ